MFERLLLAQKVQFFLAHLDNVCVLPASEDAGSRFARRWPEREAQVGIVREYCSALFCIRECSHRRATARLVNEGNGAIVKDTRMRGIGLIDLFGMPEHICAGMAVEHEITLPFREQ